MEPSLLYKLLKKYRSQTCTPEELDALNHWYSQFNKEADRFSKVPVGKLDMLFQNIEWELSRRQRQRRQFRRRLQVVAVAALWILGLIGGYYLLPQRQRSAFTVSSAAIISPGQQRAELVLADGARIALNRTTVVINRRGDILKADTSIILDYRLAVPTERESEYHTIEVPLGGEYSLILADGTKVWLNSGSVFTYPVAFTEEKREVKLRGEAYFEVVKSGHPFVVKTDEIHVDVGGTSFNVSAYPEDKQVITVLVEGKVTIREVRPGNIHEVRPGSMCTYEKKTGQVWLQKCDTDLYTSWVKGKFKFRDMALEDIMIRLNRWYNCEFFYQQSAIRDLRFTGVAEKDRPIEFLLEMIETVTDVTFEIHGRSVLLRQK